MTPANQTSQYSNKSKEREREREERSHLSGFSELRVSELRLSIRTVKTEKGWRRATYLNFRLDEWRD